jgi:histidyl-tRNA synthetase
MASADDREKSGIITPRTLKGFRDYLPEAMMPREQLIETARRVYRSYGFAPIDTPALEYLEILSGKGGEESDKQLYKFADHGGRDVGMRFDLTVPLARFAAQYLQQLGTPFKRYHIATVWRGENTQRGRYREFMQCDFDTIGVAHVASDIETALVIHDLMSAIGFSRFTIHLNNRQVLNGLLDKLGLADKTVGVLRALDKLGKAGAAAVAEELEARNGLSAEQARNVLRMASVAGDNATILDQLEQLVAGNEQGQAGVARLREILDGFAAGGATTARLRLDASIARGLDYYTGPIFETFLDDLPGIGSVCSGGRYDNLAATFSRQPLPGIGASLGLDRLLAAQEELGMIAKVRTPAPVLICFFDADRLKDYLRIAAWIRQAGIGVELYAEPKKLGPQLKYADRRGFRLALIAGQNELADNRCQIKNLLSGEQHDVSLADEGRELIGDLRALLADEPSTG